MTAWLPEGKRQWAVYKELEELARTQCVCVTASSHTYGSLGRWLEESGVDPALTRRQLQYVLSDLARDLIYGGRSELVLHITPDYETLISQVRTLGRKSRSELREPLTFGSTSAYEEYTRVFDLNGHSWSKPCHSQTSLRYEIHDKIHASFYRSWESAVNRRLIGSWVPRPHTSSHAEMAVAMWSTALEFKDRIVDDPLIRVLPVNSFKAAVYAAFISGWAYNEGDKWAGFDPMRLWESS